MKRALASLCLVLAACGAAQHANKGSSDPLSVERLYPLRAGSVWTYDVDTGQGLPTLGVTRVLSADGSHAQVASGGDPIPYELREDGLYRADRGAFVLREPIQVGRTWDAGGGATAQVRDVVKTVSTPAGDFRGCVEVVEQGGEAGKVVRTVFCPDVGPVELESSIALPTSGGSARVLARLRGYDFSGVAAP